MNHGTRCYLQGKAPTQTLDYQSGYEGDSDTKCIFSELLLSSGKAIPDTAITAVAMGYCQDLRKI